MSDLVRFIEAQLTKDEAAALGVVWIDRPGQYSVFSYLRPQDAHYLDRHDPARVLAGVAAKRRVVELHGLWDFEFVDADGDSRMSRDCRTCDNGGTTDTWPCDTLRLLASEWAGS